MGKLSKEQFVIYGIGILILTLGIALTICSQLGTSPFDALLVGLAENVGLTVGSWEIIIAILIILFNSLLGRRKLEFLGLITAVFIGIGIDFWLFLIGNSLIPEVLIAKLVSFITGLMLTGLGTAVYLHTQFAPAPLDHAMLLIRDLTKMSITVSRTLQYFVFILLAFIFNGPIGVGTVITLVLGGPILNYFIPRVERRLELFLKY